MANETATIPFQLKAGARYAEEGPTGVVIHVGGTSTGKVYLTPQQAIALQAGSPESIFEAVRQMQGTEVAEGSQEQPVGQAEAQAGTQDEAGEVEGFDTSAQTSTQAHDADVSAFLSRSAKEITAALEGVHDAKFISELHSKEMSAPKPRQAVIDALNSRYDAVMAEGKK